MSINPLNKIELSPEARAALRLPLAASDWVIRDAMGRAVITVDASVLGGKVRDAELAAFIAALLNAALAPAPAEPITDEWLHLLATVPGEIVSAPAPESNAEPHQIVTTEYEAAAGLDAEGVTVDERLARR